MKLKCTSCIQNECIIETSSNHLSVPHVSGDVMPHVCPWREDIKHSLDWTIIESTEDTSQHNKACVYCVYYDGKCSVNPRKEDRKESDLACKEFVYYDDE